VIGLTRTTHGMHASAVASAEFGNSPALGARSATAARSLPLQCEHSADESFGDRGIVRFVDVRRLLSGESNRQQPSQ
jgi:hypothetical protein